MPAAATAAATAAAVAPTPAATYACLHTRPYTFSMRIYVRSPVKRPSADEALGFAVLQKDQAPTASLSEATTPEIE